MIAGYTLVRVSDIEAIDKRIKDATDQIRTNLLVRDIESLTQYKANIIEIKDALANGEDVTTVIKCLYDVIERTEQSIAVLETKKMLSE